MPATTPRARYREVLQILARHGFGFVIRPRVWPFGGNSYDAPEAEAIRRPAELRQALEELGTTFIKLGQILSTRPDLLPPAYIAELQKLQDAVPAAPTALITERIEEQLRRPVDALFTAFDPIPLAAASIGQVHAVTLPGGIDAVVKVQRPGVREQVMLDLRIATRSAHLMETRLKSEERTGIDVPALVDEFAWILRNELDYLREATNAEVFQRNFADNPHLRVPAICWEYTT
ncbi:MAG: AarF/UbiB family protein, partial [Chloroflexota bacterium]|nr:AarF/UbiB family protein [Chloroflexota bacterium]